MKKLCVVLSIVGFACINRAYCGNDEWTSIQGPPGGYSTAVDFCPAPLTDIYASSDSFLYKSTNAGLSWQITSHPQKKFNDVAIGKSGVDYYVFTATTDGIYRGLNGTSWVKVWDFYCECIVLDRDDVDTIYAIADTDSGTSVIRSTDCGDSWKAIQATGAWCSLEIDPIDAKIVYAGQRRNVGNGLWVSYDAGISWHLFGPDQGVYFVGKEIEDIDVSPKDNQVIFVVVNYTVNNDISEIWRCTDGEWVKVLQSGNCESYGILVISKTSPDTILAFCKHWGASPGARSFDEGTSWEQFEPAAEWPPFGLNDISSSPIVDGFFVVATISGLALSTDFFSSYKFTYMGLLARYSVGVTSSSQIEDDFLICNSKSYNEREQGQTWRTTSGGSDWQMYPETIHQNEGPVEPIHTRIIDTNRIYLIGSLWPILTSYGFLVSENAGETYDTVFLCDSDTSLSCFDVHNNIVYLVGNDENGCHLWRSVYPFMQWDEKTTYAPAKGYCLKIHPFVDSCLYCGGLNIAKQSCAFWKTTDCGNTYVTPANNGLPTADGNNNVISSVVTSFSIPDKPIIIFSGLKSLAGRQSESIGVYKSTDFGENWTHANLDEEINELTVDPLDPSIVYAATPNGIYVSHDYCGHWISLNQGLEEVSNKCYAIDLSTNRPHLFCGTRHGVFKYSPITLVSGTSTATGYQAPKMIEYNNQAYLAYQTLGGVYFGTADLNGDVKIREFGAKEGEFPCITLDASNKPCVVWQRNVEISPNQKGGELWFSKYDGYNWTEPHRLVSFVGLFGEDVNLPSFIVDPSTNIGYVTFEERNRYMDGPDSRLYLGWFPIDNPSDTHFVQLDYAESPIRCEFPSISLGNNYLYIAFQKEHKIYRVRYETTSCDTTWLLVSNASRYSHHPYVDMCTDGSVNYVWEDSTSSDVEIYWAFEDGDSLWHQGNVSQNPRKSQWPQICRGTRWITWSQEESTPIEPAPWNIWYKNLATSGSGQRITQTTTISKYSHGVITATPSGGKLTVMCTEGNQSPFEVKICSIIDSTIDVTPPSAPYVNPVEKSEDDVLLTWNKVITDTLGNAEEVAYYVVYRDTFPSFVPDSLDSIAYVNHPDTTYLDAGALNVLDSYYYLVKAVDAVGNRSKKSNMGYKLNKSFNENETTTDRNWVSLPWHSNYTTVDDLVNDLSPAGDPLTKVIRLRDDQKYESYLWDPEWFWDGINFTIESGRGYEMITTKDTSLFLVGSGNPDGLVTLNENPTTTDRNWVSIPYDAAYGNVSDITDEYSPSGNPLTKIVNLRNDQKYESWLWDPEIVGWDGIDFVIEQGRGYEFVTIVDTTWNPTEYSNEVKGFRMAGNKKHQLRDETYCGTFLDSSDRIPVWILKQSSEESPGSQSKAINAYLYADEYRLNPMVSAKIVDFENRTTSHTEKQQWKGGTGNIPDEIISHVVRAYIPDACMYSDIVFTTYRLNNPKDVLTEKMIGSNTVRHQELGALWFDVGNFKIPWKNGEEVLLVIEAVKKGKPYIDIENFKIDETVDIQELGKIKLVPSFNFESHGQAQLVLKRSKSIGGNIIGYSLFDNGKRLNDRILQDECLILPGVSVKLVIVGGYETVYSSDGMRKEPSNVAPLSFAFGVAPNPFVKQTRIDYALPKQTSIKIMIYDVSGRLVKTLVSETQNSGYYSIMWNGLDDRGRQSATGIYIIRLEAGEFGAQDKILLVK